VQIETGKQQHPTHKHGELTMPNVNDLMPQLEGEEMVNVQAIINDMDDESAKRFAGLYMSRRRDPMLILLTTLLGFVVVAGVQRFLLGQIGMGLLYIFTAGLCLIGTIVDLVNYKTLAFDYNLGIAREVAVTVNR
jgi:TM2 domain-containing membrane protein YozV